MPPGITIPGGDPENILEQTPNKPPHYGYSIWQFVLSLLAILGLLFTSGLFFLFASLSGIGQQLQGIDLPQAQDLTFFMFAGALSASALLLAPSAIYALRRILGKSVEAAPRLSAFLRPTLLIFWLPVIILLGQWVANRESIAWLFLPTLHILAIGLPVLWLISLAVRRLPLGSQQRRWGVFGSGLVLGPAIILFLETLALVAFGVAGYLFLINQPELIDQLSQLVESYQFGMASENELLQAVLPWLTRPGVILAVIGFASLLVPLIEEALKPIGVWLLAGFKLSPAAGFAAGALSGAGFALFESLALTASGTDWAASVLVRIGTAVIHIANTSLMGWALTLAWRQRRYLNLLLTYLAVVAIHGLWNALAIFNLIDQVFRQLGEPNPSQLISWAGQAAPYLLVGIGLGLLALLLWMNARLARSETSLSVE